MSVPLFAFFIPLSPTKIFVYENVSMTRQTNHFQLIGTHFKHTMATTLNCRTSSLAITFACAVILFSPFSIIIVRALL